MACGSGSIYWGYIPGDANRDGCVNLVDVNYVGQFWGATGVPGTVEGDVNCDGKVDLADINLIGANWGRGCPSG